jgi:hypothetical protein
MIPTIKATLIVAFLGLSLVLLASNAQAEIKPGVRGASYFDPNKGAIGGELLMDINREQTLFFNPNVEYVFLDRAGLWTFNFDVHYDLLSAREPVYVWVGGGPAILHRDPDLERLPSDTDFGVNVFAGVGFKLKGTSLIPYIQPKYTFSDNGRFSLAFGVRF